MPERRAGGSAGSPEHREDATRETPRPASRMPQTPETVGQRIDTLLLLHSAALFQCTLVFLTIFSHCNLLFHTPLLCVCTHQRSFVRKAVHCVMTWSVCVLVIFLVCWMWHTRMDNRVQTSVTEGETEGRTVCWNSWTNPPVMEARGRSVWCSSFNFTPEEVSERWSYCCIILRRAQRRRRSLTKLHQNFVQQVVQGPEIRGPVGMTKAPLKGEKPGQDLRELTLKNQQRHVRMQELVLNQEVVKCLTMAINGPKDRAQTEITMLPRVSKRSRLKLVQLTEPSKQKKTHY